MTMLITERCPLCGADRTDEYCRDARRLYLQCPGCGLVFVPSAQFLSFEEERKRYDRHKNSPQDAGYRRYLSRLCTPLQEQLAPGSSGLDFGSGPSPTLPLMFEEAGHSMAIFDYFYAPDSCSLEKRYDFITAAEVVEHLREPQREMDRVWQCLKPGGTLGIMTKFAAGPDVFPQWHYKNDPTHIRFFSRRTFEWLARRWDADLIIPEDDVVLIRKNSASVQRAQGGVQLINNEKAQSISTAESAEKGLNGTRPRETAKKSLPVLYRDEHLIAVNKPSGLLVHRSNVDRNETEYAMQIVRNQTGRWVYPLHRLDKATSGVLVFALSKEIAQIMTRSFTERKVSKSYLAVVRGYTSETERIDYPLKERMDKMTDLLADHDKPPQEAVTEYRRLATAELPYPVGRYETARYSFLHVVPLTGRNHQIRRHMKHISHPVVGDTSYGDGKQNDFFRKQFGCRRLLLHAYDIEFDHPSSGQRVRIQAAPDPEFNAVLTELAWDKVALPGNAD